MLYAMAYSMVYGVAHSAWVFASFFTFVQLDGILHSGGAKATFAAHGEKNNKKIYGVAWHGM